MLDKMKDSINAAGQGISTKIKDGLESERISAKIRDDEKMIEKLIYQVGVQCVKRHAEEAGTEYEELFAEIRRLRAQIEKEKYDTELREEGYHTIYKFGIACYKKKCKVMSVKVQN